MATQSPCWSREELLVAFNIYCQTPFGKLHSRNPEIVRVEVSPALYAFEGEPFIKGTLLSLSDKSITLPEKFAPDIAFLKRHREEVFVDG